MPTYQVNSALSISAITISTTLLHNHVTGTMGAAGLCTGEKVTDHIKRVCSLICVTMNTPAQHGVYNYCWGSCRIRVDAA